MVKSQEGDAAFCQITLDTCLPRNGVYQTLAAYCIEMDEVIELVLANPIL